MLAILGVPVELEKLALLAPLATLAVEVRGLEYSDNIDFLRSGLPLGSLAAAFKVVLEATDGDARFKSTCDGVADRLGALLVCEAREVCDPCACCATCGFFSTVFGRDGGAETSAALPIHFFSSYLFLMKSAILDASGV